LKWLSDFLVTQVSHGRQLGIEGGEGLNDFFSKENFCPIGDKVFNGGGRGNLKRGRALIVDF
jgi:hypothetical protein